MASIATERLSKENAKKIKELEARIESLEELLKKRDPKKR